LLLKLQEHQGLDIDAYNIIKDGIDKLEEYQQETANSSAYILSLCK
jgi:hypothetical protein